MSAGGHSARELVAAAVKVWVRRLVDYSRSNPLLFYRDLKLGTLDLSAVPGTVERLIQGHTVAAEALVPPQDGHGLDPVVARERVEKARLHVRAALTALQRKALSNLEEKGIETLHLAVGLASWPARDGGRPYCAPVLLLPAALIARGRGDREPRLSLGGEPRLNPVLLHALSEELDRDLDGAEIFDVSCREDDAGRWVVDRQEAFDALRRLAAAVRDFTIQPRTILANFQFAKMAMVEDLQANEALLGEHAAVAAIAGYLPARQAMAQASDQVEIDALDDRPPEKDLLVLDADSSQELVIRRVARGQSGVVQGPPGTGKSQTIANLIAQSVGDGLRVLFVAEKRAALDAVVKRLDQVGLRHLILDVHGAAVSRKEVMANLAEALEQIRRAGSVVDAGAVHREFAARRAELNEHARRVNVEREPFGLSVHQVVGKLLRLPSEARSEVRLRGAEVLALTGARANALVQRVEDAAARGSLVLGLDTSPWNRATLLDGESAQRALDLVRDLHSELLPAFEQGVDAAFVNLGLRRPRTLDEAKTFLGLFDDVGRILEEYEPEIFRARPGVLAATLAPASLGWMRRVWSLLTDATTRAARRDMLALRSSPAPVATLHAEAVLARDLLRRWDALSNSPELPRVPAGARGMEAALARVVAGLAELKTLTGAVDLADQPLEALARSLAALAQDQRTPYELPDVNAIRAELESSGLSRFLADLRATGAPNTTWSDRFRYVWLHSVLDAALAADSKLASFRGVAHEKVVAEFQRLDRERIDLAARRVRRLHAERAIEAMNEHFSEASLIRAEAQKKSRHLPIRTLLGRAPNVLTRVAPCWVASPLSVSQLLAPDTGQFDIVVFDEASQVLQEEAVPALYRAERVVVAGDRHQLPPTTFFATAIEEVDESGEVEDATASAAAAIGGYESLLDTLGAFLPNWMLEWHYRSEDERLITFSNTNIYSGRLVTFPSAGSQEVIRHVLVPHDPALGSQEESSSREVEAVVGEVLSHAERMPEESLGVITMGIKHANRVQGALDRALEDRPDLADFFALDRPERFFVKNLETVQGDERDSIILSIGYGKAANGDLPHRFGPLTHEAGHRRLNVAITRAKRRMCVISSFSHHEVDLERSQSRGVRLLKAYLEYAAGGGARLSQSEIADGTPLNAFEADVRDALEARGIRTVPQYGASRYRIDLAALHPEQPGRPVLAIECDGAAYHSSASARDRDRLRQAHLERLGWRFHRIWSTDWFYSREEEIERAAGAYSEAVARAEGVSSIQEPAAQAGGSVATERAVRPPVTSDRTRTAPRPNLPFRPAIDEYPDRELLALAGWVLSDGLLRTREELIRDILEELPFNRMGARIRERLERIAQKTEKAGA